MATTYHPQVYRGSSSPAAAAPSLSSSARGHAAPHSPSTPRRTATTTTTSTSTAPPAARSSHARQRSSTYSRLRQAKPECTLPAYGLSTDPSQFPLHPSSTPDVPFRTITADQFAEMNHAHADLKVNESVLFPWMHGSDFPNTQQAANFGYTNGNRQRVPRFRGLTTLFARSEARQRDSNDSQVQPPHSRNPTSASLASSCSTDSFVSSSSYATTQSASCSSFSSSSGSESPGADPDSRASSIFGSSGSLSTTPSSLGSSPPSKHGHEQGPEECSCLLTNVWFPEEVFHPTAPNSFYPPLLPAGISFRHFRMQSAKYTSISDIVIYSENGGYTAEAVGLAKRARLAMIDCEKDRLERGDDQCLSYEVYVVTDPFYVFEQRYPYLVAIDSSHFARNQVNFVEKEHEEMRDFTQATEIADNVWLGNSFDAPPLDLEGEYEAHGRRTSADSATSTFASNPLAFAICVEAGDQATMSTQRELRSKERYMDDLQDQRLLEAHYAEVERKNKAAVAKRSTFWFSSSSGSSSEDDSDFDDFGEDDSSSDKENAASFAGTGSAEDAALSLSLAQQGSLDATPVKLQYKKQSKSLRHARDAKVASILGVSPSALPMARTSTPAVPTSRPVLQASPAEIVRLQAISSAHNATSVLQQTAVVDSILELVVWLRAQARPHLRTSMEQRGARGQVNNLATTLGTSPRRVLIHCADGYTDSSLLALAYIMYDRVCSLPDAYLFLQNEKKRSFFVYPADVAVLGALEQKINYVARCQNRVRFNDDLSREQIQAVLEQERQQIKEKEKERLAVQAKQQQQQQQQQAPSPMGALSLSATARSYLPSRPSLFGRQGSANSVASSSTIRGPSPASSTSSATSRSASPSAVPQGLSNASTHPWFYSEKYDGHFPSRILDFLYLGNLNHATNPLMLKQLGITHVLSIGESALVPPAKQAPAPGSTSSAAKARTPTNSLWVEQSLGNMTVCDIQDIQDDGCDVILPHLVTAMEFIHAAHKAGGKVLVHCRVGVSRSATLVIAYVMKHLDLSLVDAYLMVRARRLNILIQPTILFMWTLHMWEEEIRESGVDDEGVVIRERAGRISWPVLATEIANLNNKYLGC